MIGVFVSFQYPDALDRAIVEKIAHEARGTFEGMPDLRYKYFTYDEQARRATNFYVWESENAARAFFSDALRERVTGLYGVAPSIEFVEIAEIVDNAR